MEPNDHSFVPDKHSKPTLADLLTIQQTASIFYSYARELELSRIFEDRTQELTLLVPVNKAVMALARKPYVFVLVQTLFPQPYFPFPLVMKGKGLPPSVII